MISYGSYGITASISKLSISPTEAAGYRVQIQLCERTLTRPGLVKRVDTLRKPLKEARSQRKTSRPSTLHHAHGFSLRLQMIMDFEANTNKPLLHKPNVDWSSHRGEL